jgi:hypothetical protein
MTNCQWAQDQIFVTLRKLRVCWCGTPSLMRGGVCRLRLLLALARAVIFGSKPRGTRDHILLPQIQHSPNMEGQVPVFISPRNRVAQSFSRALGSLFVASDDSQGYGGGIPTRLHTDSPWTTSPRYIAPARTAQKTFLLLLCVLSLLGKQRIHRAVP